MASSFAAQLSQIAAKSSVELDLKAQKASHSESLIFDRRVAGSQDIESIYQICLEGFQELCQLDLRFSEFERNLFNAQSKSSDRSRMTAQENKALDTVLEVFLGLVGRRLLLRPAIKAVEWLVRRFKIHLHNTAFVLSTFLPYHETPVFRNLLSILPAQIPPEYKFLGPYLKTATNPPRHAIVYSATNSDGLFTALNSYTIQVCRDGASHSTLMSFWGTIVVEAVAGRLMLAQSGRKDIQKQRQEDVLFKVLPLLNDGFSLTNEPDMVLVCYTISMILASKCDLADDAIDSLTEAVAATLESSDKKSGLTCLIVLASRRSKPLVSKVALSYLMETQGLIKSLQDLAPRYTVDRLVQALAAGALGGMKKKNCISRISFVENLVRMSTAFSDKTLTAVLLGELVETIQKLSAPTDEVVKDQLMNMVQKLGDSESILSAVAQAMAMSSRNVDEMESLLGTVLTPQIEQAAPAELSSAMDLDLPSPSEDLNRVLSHLPERTVDQHSFLVSTPSHLFKQLEDAFQVCCNHQGGIGQFENLPIWLSTELESPLYLSFLLRVACSNKAPVCRSSSLRLLARNLSARKSPLDAQALVPYIAVCLVDPAQNVRRAASEALLGVLDVSPKEGDTAIRWGSKFLYDPDRHPVDDEELPSQHVVEIIRGAFMPVLEECIFDSTQIRRAINSALNGSSNITPVNSRTDGIQIKKSLRRSLFSLFAKHLLATPLFKVKIELVGLLDGVERVGTMSKTKALSPLLLHWIGLDIEKATELVEAEGLSLVEVDRAMTLAISATGKEALSQLLSIATEIGTELRPGFVEALFGRLKTIWKDLSPEGQSLAAAKLFDLSVSPIVALKMGARNVLRSAELPTSALINMVRQSAEGAAKMQEHAPPRKRRRASHGQSSTIPPALLEEHDFSISRLTFILELVDSSKPENRLELLGELFQILSLLQSARQRGQVQLPYLLRLCLGSMLAIVKKAGISPKADLDLSVVRIELVTDCVRTVENPQVQNTALLLIAALATVEPDHVLHSVMPIFTFMSNSVLAKDDEHSVHVANQTMDQVIPPLVNAVRQKDGDSLIRPMSDLLSSFAAAFDHIPPHRRLGLFQRLLLRLGPNDFSCVTIGMLTVRKPGDLELLRFFTELMDSFGAATQLVTCRKLLALVKDVFSSQPDNAQIVAGINVSSPVTAKRKTATSLLSTSIHLMQSQTLKAQINALSRLDHDTAARIRDELRSGFNQILELTKDPAVDTELATALNQYLETFLSLPPLVEYFESLPQVLGEIDQDLRVDVLRALESRLSRASHKDGETQGAAIGFLPVLTKILTTTTDVAFKMAAIACIDRISEMYGRKDKASVVSAAQTISSDQCLGSHDSQLQVVALLCLASIAEILKENVIPVVPELMPRVFQLLEDSIDGDEPEDRLHNACFSLLAALASHVPFLISETYLDSILTLSADSANTELGEECEESRREFLQLLARKTDLKQLVSGLSRTWTHAVENDVTATLEALSLFSNSIEHSSRSAVVRTADLVSNFILQALDLRHIQLMVRTEDSYSNAEIDRIEAALHEVMIKFIYRLNDNVFRPLFTIWVDWAVECPGLATTGLSRAKMLRQTSLFNFTNYFFMTLKSIVTSYASYILEPAVEVLKRVASLAELDPSPPRALLDVDETVQYQATLSTLSAAAQNDQDAFFASPSHFSPLHEALVAQLSLAAHKHSLESHVYQHVIPAIVALAMAVVDTPAHHVTMNKLICKLRHSEHAAVRMASIKCQASLTASEDVGEEWVNNIVSGGGETMVYVNEMLEDDDEGVEREVRKWVRRVREMVGEDVFET